jgi:hypothetical protein
VIFTRTTGGGGGTGLKSAKGSWLLFADADDFFNYCIHDILDEYKHADADIIFFKSNGIASDDYAEGVA